MSVARTREVNARLRARGITVHEWPGWESRGNGQTSAYEGGLVHHTATPYGFAPSILVNGRPDLSGPLCNYAGNEDGSVTVIAAHPANHAGASGGYSMGPLPVTSTFNRRVMGLEIVYPGTYPMRPAQYHTANVWARVVADVCGYGDIQRARAHAETSVTGKWDPGDRNGHTIDMAAFRAASVNPSQEDTMSEADAWNGVAGLIKSIKYPGQGDDVRSALVEIVKDGAWWGIAEMIKSLPSTSAADVRAVLVQIAKDGNSEVLTAIANLTPGAPTDEQVAELADKLGAHLGGAYQVTITRNPGQ